MLLMMPESSTSFVMFPFETPQGFGVNSMDTVAGGSECCYCSCQGLVRSLGKTKPSTMSTALRNASYAPHGCLNCAGSSPHIIAISLSSLAPQLALDEERERHSSIAFRTAPASTHTHTHHATYNISQKRSTTSRGVPFPERRVGGTPFTIARHACWGG